MVSWASIQPVEPYCTSLLRCVGECCMLKGGDVCWKMLCVREMLFGYEKCI